MSTAEAQAISRLRELLEVAVQAGAVILDVYRKPLEVRSKDDSSPVTVADERAEQLICDALQRLCPDVPVVAEERVAAGILPAVIGDLFFLVDPLDGTREFVEGRPDFTVNIALIAGGKPVLGIVYAPGKGMIYWGSPEGAYRGFVAKGVSGEADMITDVAPIATRPCPSRAVVVSSRSHASDQTQRFIDSLGDVDLVSVGSSQKFCTVAAGEADIYPRFGRTMEWDIAAGHAILAAAGGQVVSLDGEPMLYGKRDQADDSDFANPFFIASGSDAGLPHRGA